MDKKYFKKWFLITIITSMLGPYLLLAISVISQAQAIILMIVIYLGLYNVLVTTYLAFNKTITKEAKNE